jgi:diguanylate cyclase (GGDEF)-like protein
MILMPETAATSAFKAAERLRRIVSSTSFETNAGPLTFSVSVGVATLNKSCKSLEQLLERADFASYVSKDAGGNRVTRWTASISRKG